MRVLAFLIFCAISTFSAPVFALERPDSKPILTVSGQISTTNQGNLAVFDRELLQQLEWVEVETFTSFTEGPQRFAGPTLSSLLDALGVSSGQILATAINDYAIKIPVNHADKYDVILAMDMNGTAMRVRDKGPIWVVYPLSEEEAALKPFDGEMIWQLNRL